MTAPTKYTRQQNFLNDQNANPSAPFNGPHLDSEFDAIKASNNAVIDNLALIQRSDGVLNNGVVKADSLDSTVLALIQAKGWNIRGAWATAINYAVGDVIINNNTTYVCAVAHTSGTFSVDYSNLDWFPISAMAAAINVLFTPSGTLTKNNLQDELIEIDSLKAAKADLASVVDRSHGSSLVGYLPSGTGATGRTVQDKLGEFVSVKDFGAKGDGTTDDTAAIQAAVNATNHVHFPHGTYKTSSKITLNGYTHLHLAQSTIAPSDASQPVFEFGAVEGLKIDGGVIIGSASSFLHAIGAKNTPSAITDYSRGLYLNDIRVSGLGAFLQFDNAVRQVFIKGCYAGNVTNGIVCNGKCVDIHIGQSLIYGSGASNSTGIQLISPGGSSYYNEGFHITTSTIDGFTNSFDVRDIFVLAVANCYIGGLSNSFSFGQLTSTRCSEITIRGGIIASPIVFTPVNANQYRASISAVFTNITGQQITLNNNAKEISVESCRFESSTNGIGVVAISNNGNLRVTDCDFDSTFIGGVQIKSTGSPNSYVDGNTYRGTGDLYYFEQPVLLGSINAATAQSYGYGLQTAKIPSGSYANNATLVTTNQSLAAGQRARIVGRVNVDSSTGGFLVVNVPSNITIPYGTGWSSSFIYVPGAGSYHIDVPCYATADVANGAFTVSVSGITTLALDSHGWLGVQLI